MGRFIIGLIVMIIGLIVIWKRQWFVYNLGQSRFFMEYFGSMYGFYSILGSIVMALGFIYAIGIYERILERLFG